MESVFLRAFLRVGFGSRDRHRRIFGRPLPKNKKLSEVYTCDTAHRVVRRHAYSLCVTETTKQTLLEMAAKRIGRAELAKRLAVPESLLEAWIGGHATMPDRKLLVLADLIEVLGD